MDSRLDKIEGLVLDEFVRASREKGKFHSTHEGYAVILEELDEAWDAIKLNDIPTATGEMIQVAAMAQRWLYDFGLLSLGKRSLRNTREIQPGDQGRVKWVSEEEEE